MRYDFKSLNRIAIVLDDHALFAESFSKILNDLHLFENVLHFTNEKELKQFLMKNRFDQQVYLFLDYYLKETVVTSVIQEFRLLLKKPKVIIISGISNPLLIKSLFTIRPDGIIHKSDQMADILECIQEVSESKTYYSSYINELIGNVEATPIKFPFSNREMELLLLFSRGLTVEETAAELNISPHTVSGHRQKMFAKCNCKNISELLGYARKLEII